MRIRTATVICLLLTVALPSTVAQAGLFSSLAGCRSLFGRLFAIRKKAFDYTRFNEERWDVLLTQTNLRETKSALQRLFLARGDQLTSDELSSLTQLILAHLFDLQQSEPSEAWELFETLRVGSRQVDLSPLEIELLKETFRRATELPQLNQRAARKIRNLVDFQPFGKPVPDHEARLSGELSPHAGTNYLRIKPVSANSMIIEGVAEGRAITPIDVTRESEQKVRIADRVHFPFKSVLEVTRTGPNSATIVSPSHDGIALTVSQLNPREAEITGTFVGEASTKLHAAFDGKTITVSGILGRARGIQVAIEFGPAQARQISEDPMQFWTHLAVVAMAKMKMFQVRIY